MNFIKIKALVVGSMLSLSIFATGAIDAVAKPLKGKEHAVAALMKKGNVEEAKKLAGAKTEKAAFKKKYSKKAKSEKASSKTKLAKKTFNSVKLKKAAAKKVRKQLSIAKKKVRILKSDLKRLNKAKVQSRKA